MILRAVIDIEARTPAPTAATDSSALDNLPNPFASCLNCSLLLSGLYQSGSHGKQLRVKCDQIHRDCFGGGDPMRQGGHAPDATIILNAARRRHLRMAFPLALSLARQPRISQTRGRICAKAFGNATACSINSISDCLSGSELLTDN